jgi:hypothetical protein
VAIFIINEWLPEDSSGINGRNQQKEAFTVITKLSASDHKIVVIERSPFEQKFWNLCKNNNDVVIRGIARAYMMSLRSNFNRCLILKLEETAPIPVGLAGAKKNDDHYLLRAQVSVKGAILVTTDLDLCQAAKQAGLSCMSRDEFMQTLN